MMAEQELSFDERMIQRLEAEYESKDPNGGKPPQPVEVSDVDDTPEPTAESEDDSDGVLSAEDTDETESDVDDDTPEEEELDDIPWEQRYKDSQKDIQESREAAKQATEQLESLRAEESAAMADITGARFELQDLAEKNEQIAQHWANKALLEVQQARSINFANIPPEQVAQAQQWQQQAEINYQRTQAELSQTIESASKARADAIAREAAISRAKLTREIPNFDEVYPELGKFAVDNGVNPKVFQEIVDPGLIKAIYKLMTLSATPNTIEAVKKTIQAKAPRAKSGQNQPRSIDGKFKRVDEAYRKEKDPKQRARLWEERTALRLAKEKGNR